jgi:hypothetical protein
MSDLRTTLGRGVGGATPPPDGYERMLRRRERKQRNQRVAAGLMGIAVFVVAIWIATGGPIDRGQAPASMGPGLGPDVGPIGLFGLPAEGATPSVPTRSELVLSFTYGHSGGDPGRFTVHVLADGRMIWERYGDADYSSTGLVEQRLSPEGVDLLLAEAIATGLADHNVHLIGARGLNAGAMAVRSDGRLVHVGWGEIGLRGPKEMPTAEQAGALQQLDTRLEDPMSWLPASAWEDPEMKPYVPSTYGICLEAVRGSGLDAVLASIPQRAADVLRAWPRTKDVYDAFEGSFVTWCSEVTTQEARQLSDILLRAGLSHPGGPDLQYKPDQLPALSISFSPRLPNEK